MVLAGNRWNFTLGMARRQRKVPITWMKNGAVVTGWREVDGEWYYFHEDGGMNLGELILDNGKYEFSAQGALVSGRLGGKIRAEGP